MPDTHAVLISLEAGNDLAAIDAHIASDSPQNADRVLERLFVAIESLNRFPNRYKVYRRGTRPGRLVRSMPVVPFVVYYQVIDADRVVRILTVRHGARRRPKTLG